MYRDFPLESIHKHAFKAAEAAGCAGEQGKFWEMHERLFANQASLDPSGLLSHGQAVGLDMSKFKQCLDSGTHATDVKDDFTEGQKAGVKSTPTFFLVSTDPNSRSVKVIEQLVGARHFSVFKQSIDKALAAQN